MASSFASSAAANRLTCPCGQILGSAFCCCGRAFSAVQLLALGSGAGALVVASSRRAPSGLVGGGLVRSRLP